MDVPDLHRRAVDSFGERVRLIGDDQWHLPTPCSDWDVRDLVHHLTYEAAWTPAMFAGMTIAEAGDRFEGDLLGHDPQQAWERVSAPAVAAVNEPGAMQRTVHLSFGDFSGEFYAGQLFADYLIHSWDLARAISADEQLDPELVERCGEWFDTQEDAYRAGGAVGPPAAVSHGADPQTVLLARFGRSA